MKKAKFLIGTLLLSLTVLTSCSSDDSNPNPVEQNGKILFEAQIGNNSHIFVMNIDGSNETQLTNFTNSNGIYTGDASWSPDASKVVFITGKDNDGGSGIYIMNSNGSNITRINHTFIGEGEQNPKYSPNGSKILFETQIGNDSHIFVMNTDGSNEIQLTNFTNANGVYTGDASWSSDGSKIIFQTNKDNDGDSGIYVMNSDGSNVVRVNHSTVGEGEQNPKFSPDGTKILFETQIGDNSHIFVMNVDGTNEIQLTNYTSSNGVYTGDASWNANGSKIIFITDKDNDGGSRIYTMNADGSNVTRVNHNFIGDGEQNPVWK